MTTIPSYNQENLNLKTFPRTWVPIGSIIELDPDRPTPIEFLGQKYVTYRDKEDEHLWIVVDDICPHRLAPLSEGRIDREKNILQCSYHGWEFNTEGKCTHIPQANMELEQRAISLPKSSVASYPTYVENSIIFVWPWSEDMIQYSNETWRFPEGMMKDVSPIVSTFTRDLPYGWSHLVENLIDPAHVPFAHHGMQGKRTDAIPINMTVPTGKGESGFSFYWEDRTMGMIRKGNGGFHAPYTVWYDAKFETPDPKPRVFELSVLCIPTRPGWSRAIVLTTRRLEVSTSSTDPKKQRPSLMSRIFKALPIWLIHILNNRFLDSDAAFLHYQERELVRRRRRLLQRGHGDEDVEGDSLGGPLTENHYFMPSPADRCIGALRQWIAKYTSITADDDAYFKTAIPPPMSRTELFDRYTQHTIHCKECQRGLETLKKYRRWAYGILAVSVLGLDARRIARVTLLLSLAVVQVCSILERAMKVGEFKHHENH